MLYERPLFFKDFEQVEAVDVPTWRLLSRQELRQILERIMEESLAPRERIALLYRYGCWNGYDHTIKEVAILLRVSPTRCAQIIRLALRKLRRTGYMELVDFIESSHPDSQLQKIDRTGLVIRFLDKMDNVKKGDKLTPAEMAVFRLLGRGMTNEEISSSLFISINTVRSHLKNIYKKIGY